LFGDLLVGDLLVGDLLVGDLVALGGSLRMSIRLQE
jgi:hypothetical protein